MEEFANEGRGRQKMKARRRLDRRRRSNRAGLSPTKRSLSTLPVKAKSRRQIKMKS